MQVLKKSIAKFEGVDVVKYSLIAANKFQVDILNYGGVICGILAPDKNGKLDNVVLAYDDFDDYLQNIGYFGAIVGRHAGRIGEGKFTIDGVEYHLDCNRNGNNLHGGNRGLDKRIWDVSVLDDGIKLSYTSPHLEEKYPGNIVFEITYQIDENNTLSITSKGIPDRKTLINLTNHTSFNLSGGERLASNHQLQLNSSKFCAADASGLFTGTIDDVSNTPFDFRQAKAINKDINNEHPQLGIVGGGYDHPFVLNKETDFAAQLVDLVSGRSLSVYTSEPVLVVYSGNFLSPGGKINQQYYAQKHLGICLEAQNIPNAINIQDLANKSLYTPDTPYTSYTKWIFAIER